MTYKEPGNVSDDLGCTLIDLSDTAALGRGDKLNAQIVKSQPFQHVKIHLAPR